MSQISDYTKKLTKIEKKNRTIILGSEFSEAKNELTFRIHQKMTKIEKKKIEKLFLAQNGLKQIMSQLLDYTKKLTKIENFFGSELSEANNEPTFRIH